MSPATDLRSVLLRASRNQPRAGSVARIIRCRTLRSGRVFIDFSQLPVPGKVAVVFVLFGTCNPFPARGKKPGFIQKGYRHADLA